MSVFVSSFALPKLTIRCLVAAAIMAAAVRSVVAQVRVEQRGGSNAGIENLPLDDVKTEGRSAPLIQSQDLATTPRSSPQQAETSSPPVPDPSVPSNPADSKASSADARQHGERQAIEKVRDTAVALAHRWIVPKQSGTARGSAEAKRDENSTASATGAWKTVLATFIRSRMNRNAADGTPGGVALVRFTVNRAGDVSGVALASSSGFKAIDRAALAAVRGPMPAAPAGVGPSTLSVTVPLRFVGGD